MSVLDENRTFILFKKQGMFRSPCYNQPLWQGSYFGDYEKRVNKSGIIQAFNHEIAQQNQVKLRVGRVMFEFVYEFEDKEVYNIII